MSLTRHFLREMRPLFRMLDDVSFGRSGAPYFPSMTRMEPFQNMLNHPAVDVSDAGTRYVVEADLPGVPKENVRVRIGDNGRSVTIEGRVTEGSEASQPKSTEAVQENTTNTPVTKADDSAAQLSTERQVTRNVQFTRTVWLPRPVDSQTVTANLKNGVLSITMNKAEDKEGTYITVNES